MSALNNLIQHRSQLAEAILAYLHAVALEASQVPAYYPEHLQKLDSGSGRFDGIRQLVELHDRKAYDEWRFRERERLRAAGQSDEGFAYREHGARTRVETEAAMPEETRFPEEKNETPKPPPVVWDATAGQRFRRAVILGDPGSGKSWLLRYEARTVALTQRQQLVNFSIPLDQTVLPFRLRFADFGPNDADFTQHLICYVNQLIQLKNPHLQTAIDDFIKQQLENGQAVVLLDALDEVENPQRQGLRKIVHDFAKQFPRIRILMSSRLVGYEGMPFAQGQELEILPFNSQQIELSTQAWFSENDGNGLQQRHAFLNVLNTRPTLFALARIPLMLAMLCRVFQESPNEFPVRRVELSDRCLRGLLGDWNNLRPFFCKLNLTISHIKAIIEILAPVAYKLWVAEKQQFHEDELDELLFNELSGLPANHNLRGISPADLIEILKEAGVLVAVSTAKNAELLFLHLTFHEYLAAQVLVKRISTLDDNTIKSDYLNLIKWSEPLCLAAQKISNLEEIVRWTKLAFEIDFEFGARIAGSAREEFQNETVGISKILDVPEWYKVLLLGISASEEAIPLLSEYLKSESLTLSWYAAHALSHLGPKGYEILIGEEQLDFTKYWITQALEAYRINQTGGVFSTLYAQASVRSESISTLINELRSPQNWAISRAIFKLTEFGPAAICAVPTLLPLLNNADDDIRLCAAGTLLRIDPENSLAMDTLLSSLGSSDEYVRKRAVEQLGFSGSSAALAVPALIALFENENERAPLISEAAKALEKIGPLAVDAVPHLLKEAVVPIARPESWEYVSSGYNAARALGAIGSAAVPALITILVNRGDWCSVAAEELGRIGKHAADAVPALLEAATDRCYTQQESLGYGPYILQCKALRALGKIGYSANAVEQQLLDELGNEYTFLYKYIIETLGRIGSPKSLMILKQQLIVTKQYNEIIRQAIHAIQSRYGLYSEIFNG